MVPIKGFEHDTVSFFRTGLKGGVVLHLRSAAFGSMRGLTVPGYRFNACDAGITSDMLNDSGISVQGGLGFRTAANLRRHIRELHGKQGRSARRLINRVKVYCPVSVYFLFL